MVSDVLSRLIKCGMDDGLITGVKMNQHGPNISHLFFADDTLLFLQVNCRNCENIQHILNRYCLASGQLVNVSKSSVYFGRSAPT